MAKCRVMFDGLSRLLAEDVISTKGCYMTVIDKGAEPYRSTILALGKILGVS